MFDEQQISWASCRYASRVPNVLNEPKKDLVCTDTGNLGKKMDCCMDVLFPKGTQGYRNKSNSPKSDVELFWLTVEGDGDSLGWTWPCFG